MTPARQNSATDRVEWVDYAKGWCILLVVMMHSTLGLEQALGADGWLGAFVAWARPFRMPDFFLIAGLFLYRTIDRDWPVFLDRKVLHFVYFYALWLVIQCLFKCWGSFEDGLAGAALGFAGHLATALYEPLGTLWFIYLLPMFFVLTKLVRHMPAALVFLVAAMLQSLNLKTGYTVIDETAARYVYFFTGYAASPFIFQAAEKVRRTIWPTALALIPWGLINGWAVISGAAVLPGISLLLGFAGAGAVIVLAVLLARLDILHWLRFMGSRSIVIYLAFFLPMAAARTAIVKFAPGLDIGTGSLLITIFAIGVPLGLFALLERLDIRFLFRRPDWLRLRPAMPRN